MKSPGRLIFKQTEKEGIREAAPDAVVTVVG